jgi:hypothetical protein
VKLMRLRSAMLLLSSMVFAAPDVYTHPLPDSQIFLDVGRDEVEAELRLPVAQFEIGFGRSVPRTSEALSASLHRDIARYVADHLTASHPDGTRWCTEVRDVKIVSEAGVAHIYVTAALIPRSQPTPRNFVLRTTLIVHELFTHRLFVYLRRDWKIRAANVEPFVLGRITYRTNILAIDLFEGTTQ